MFTPRLVRPTEPPAAALGPVRLAVLVDGVEIGATEIAPDRASVPVRLEAPRQESRDEYTFELDSRSIGAGTPRPDELELREVLVRCGEPLRASDFKLTFPRDRKRIEHVATVGLPCGPSPP